MLSMQSMREGASRSIEVVGCPAEAVRLLLALVYTGAPAWGEEDLCAWDMLAALDLAHRWQLLHTVQLLAGGLARRVDFDTFEAAADAGLRLDLPPLQNA